MKPHTFFSTLLVLFTAAATVHAQAACFPYGRTFPKTNGTPTPPGGLRRDWWCPADRYYGFLGYVRDLKGGSCGDAVYSLASLRTDFARMSADGAKLVRIYGPVCDQRSVWDNIVRAAAENNLGVLGIVWHGYDPAEEAQWRNRKAALLDVLRTNPLAKYVIHSVSFGSEPLFSWSISNVYLAEFRKLKEELKAMNIPITVSEMKYGFDQAPQDVSNAVKAGIDFISAHIMPYYGNCLLGYQQWEPIKSEIAAYRNMIPGKQMMITQNPWGSSHNGRNRGGNCGGNVWNGVDLKGAKDYWWLWTSNCQWFKQQRIGWFAHTFSQDSEWNFGIYKDDRRTKLIDTFTPRAC